MAQELSSSLLSLQNLPGSFHYLFSKTAEKYEADLILIDMGPSLGSINRNLLMTSDYFIVPMFPDFFSVMATVSLASILSQWSIWAKQGRALPILREATYPFPDKIPKFLGTIIQNYRVRQGQTPAAAFNKWFEAIKEAIQTELIPVLRATEMLLPYEIYEEAIPLPANLQFPFFIDDEYGEVLGEPLLQMPDFNSLIAISQTHQAPIFDLTDEQLAQDGIVLENTRQSMDQFRNLYSEGADRIMKIVENAEHSATIS